MNAHRPSIIEVVAQLEQLYGTPILPDVVNPFELIILENVAYLVDDQRRYAVFERLRREIGIEPKPLLECPLPALIEIIREGGMQPERRAEKLHTSAKLAVEVGLEKLNTLLRHDPPQAKKTLKRFPGFAEPGADKILLFTRSYITLAPESNALRVLVRLGFAEQETDYSQTYRSLVESLEPLLPHNFDWLICAHQLLRLHGQRLCKRSTPRCEVCPVSTEFRWFHQDRRRC